MADGYIKMGSMLLTIREMEVKTTMMYPFTLLEWLLSKILKITSVGENIK